MTEGTLSRNFNSNAHSPYWYNVEWNGRDMVPSEPSHIDIRRSIDSHRPDKSIFSPIHIPFEECDTEVY